MEYALLDRKKADVYREYLTPEAYERRFDQNVFFYGASTEEEIVGVAAFEAGVESELISVAVSPDWQRQDIGSELVDRVRDLLKENGSVSLEAYLSGTEEEMEGLDRFLWRCGFTRTEEAPVGSFTLQDAIESEVLKKASDKKLSEEVKKLSDIPSFLAKEFGSYLAMNDLYYGWNASRIMHDFSSVYLEPEGITACVLLSEDGETVAGETELTLEFAHVRKECQNKLALIELLSHSLKLASEKYPADTKLAAITMNEVSESILSRILGERLGHESIRRYEMQIPARIRKPE